MAQKTKEQPTGRRINCCLVLKNPAGNAETFLPGSILPDWAVQLTNREDIWMDDDEVIVEPGAYDDMSIRQLLELAKKREIDLDTTDREEIIDGLRLWDAANSG